MLPLTKDKTVTQASETPLHTLYDLHSHSTASDGLLSPTALVNRAVEMGVHVLALTDHDTTTGIDEAKSVIKAQNLPLHLVNGVEISTLWENHEIHIVGLNIETNNALLINFLAQQKAYRFERGEEIARRLEKAGIASPLEGAKSFADSDVVTRGHFARYLVELGVAATMPQVFKKYLSKGNTGYVPAKWRTMEEAIAVIHSAGGQAVLAHPGRYGLSTKWLKRLIIQFKSDGGDAMEVAQCQQAPQERTVLAQYAIEHDLLVSQGSDFHQPCAWLELGRKLWLPAGVTPVWENWQKDKINACCIAASNCANKAVNEEAK